MYVCYIVYLTIDIESVIKIVPKHVFAREIMVITIERIASSVVNRVDRKNDSGIILYKGGSLMNGVSDFERTLHAFAEIFPPAVPETKFEKFLELLKVFSSGTLTGTVGQVLETTIKTCGVFANEKQKVQAVQYVANAYEVKCNAEIEMKRLEIESDKTKAITLYIERAFQEEIDEIHKNHILKMQELHTKKIIALYEIDKFAEIQLAGINKEYATIVRRNEGLCVLYRKYLQDMRSCNETPAHIINELSRSYMKIVEGAIWDKSIDMAIVQQGLDQSLKLLEFLSKYNNYFLPFESFIEQRKMLEEI